jgi:hypothetical protein
MIKARRVSRLSRRGSFWAIAFAFLSLTALSTAPSPLYRLYADRDQFSSFTITIVYAVYVVGVVTSLILAGQKYGSSPRSPSEYQSRSTALP